MARGDLLLALVQSGAGGDDLAFRRAAEALMAEAEPPPPPEGEEEGEEGEGEEDFLHHRHRHEPWSGDGYLSIERSAGAGLWPGAGRLALRPVGLLPILSSGRAFRSGFVGRPGVARARR